MDEPFKLFYGMVETNSVLTFTLQVSQATEIVTQLFDKLLNEGILVMPKIVDGEGMEDMCKWHINGHIQQTSAKCSEGS